MKQLIIKIRKDDTYPQFFGYRSINYETLGHKGWFIRVWKFFINIYLNPKPFV